MIPACDERLIPSGAAVAAPTQAPSAFLVERFLSSHDVKHSTKGTYKRSLKQFLRWVHQNGGNLDLLEYRQFLVSSGKSAYTVAAYITAARLFLKHCGFTVSVKTPRPGGHRKDPLTEGQLRAVLSKIDTTTLQGLRDYALINLLARTGLRTIEVSRAIVDDVRTSPELRENERLLYVQGKGRDDKDDFVVLTAEAYRPLAAYLQRRRAGKSAPLFCSLSKRNKGRRLTTTTISRIVKSAMRAAGLDSPRLTAHSLRHTAITLAVRGGASVQQAQAMARHADVRTTLCYYHDFDRVRNCAERYINF